MPKRVASLDSKFDLAGHTPDPDRVSSHRPASYNAEGARSKRAGLNTAGYVSGYRGSPIAGLEGADTARRANAQRR